ncbi:putative nuclease HARBI1 [Liolophura sinensis]|uniref:putative nuclease HARBI1 n=1 Tax=Liolophura sinensis TaxID=3198878 RepID=UPI0031598EA6
MANVLLAGLAERRTIRRERVFRDRTHPLDVLNDGDVVARYRLDRRSILQVVDFLTPALERPTNRNHAIPVVLQVLTALRYYASGSFQSLVSDLHGISVPSTSRIVRSVTTAIVNLNTYPLSISFPSNPREIAEAQQAFYEIANFPHVVSCIDGTQIAIKSPTKDEHVFVCRKNYHSLNVQATTDARLRFTSVVSRYPGSAHDSFILKQSGIWRKYQSGDFDGTIILGDSGYPLKPWLMVPFIQTHNDAQAKYNKSHKTTRCTIERAFGVAKSRFRCIHHKSGGFLMHSPEVSAQVVVAVFKLHNLCINNQLPNPEIEPDDAEEGDDDDDHTTGVTLLADGARARDELVRFRFS